MTRKFALVCAIGLLASPAVSATFYSDAASFGAATTGAVTTALPNSGPVGLGPEEVGPFSFTSNAGNLNFGTGGAAEWSTLLDGPDLAISGAESFTLGIAGGTSAFAMLIHEPTTDGNPDITDTCNAPCFDTTFLIELYIGDTLLDSVSVNPVDDAVTFFGATSAQLFDTVKVIDQTNTADNEFFNGFTLASLKSTPPPPSTVIPLPAGLPLLLAGLGALGLTRRRRA
jgi:hypothetical protein